MTIQSLKPIEARKYAPINFNAEINIQNNTKRNNSLQKKIEFGEENARPKCTFCHQLQRQREHCNLAVIFVALHFNVPIRQLMSKTRAKAKGNYSPPAFRYFSV